MRIIIFEQDYSDINTIHNAIKNLALLNKYTIHQVLTTRKQDSILHYLQQYKADSYFISITNNDPSTFELARQIRALDPTGQITLIADEETINMHTLAQQIAATNIITKYTKGTLACDVEVAFEEHYTNFEDPKTMIHYSIVS
ncbi:response regulator [Kurthia massiliensis]|uniref:response regulator n=1 Tax=Kurthia massiliensis TaxID=1033739 RepID=UPI0002888B66|nr:response regulator [Kurthia massiliensis]